MRSIKKYLPLLTIIVLSLIAWLSGVHHFVNLETFKKHQKEITLFIEHRLILSLIVYAILYTATVALSIPVATFMTILGGLLFGQWIGTTVVVISATLGACLLFLSAQTASRDILTKKAGGWVKKMQDGFQRNAFSYLLTLRLIPLFPFVAVNLVAALLQTPFQLFFIATLLGIIPGSFVYVSMGVALKEVIQQPDFKADFILNPKILTTLIGLGILSLLPVLYKKLHSRTHSQK